MFNLWCRGWTTEGSEWMRPVGRLLILLTTLLVLVMPITEHLCNWDHFLRGGQDVEFNLLAALLFAAMVVLSMSGRMVQPLLAQPAFTATIGSSSPIAPPLALGRGQSWRQAASLPSRSQTVDDPASHTLTPLRI